MSQGFFPESLLVSKPPTGLIPKCGACGLYKSGCLSPKMKPTGNGKKGILIVGEAPGGTEDAKGKQFVGKAGQFLYEMLDSLNVEMRDDCWITNALICRPPNNKIKKPIWVDYCRPNLLSTINRYKPHTIILLGGHAVRSLIGDIWREDPGGISRWAGWNIPCHKTNTWICPTWHPSYLLREKSKVLEMHFKDHLEKAFSHTKPPWTEVPDWESNIEVITDTDRAASILREMERRGGEIAFDYENNCLKPESRGGEIVCASACWEGKRTIAYPWAGAVIKATGELLKSDRCAFIASNLKHEERWTRKIFGHGVRHWFWDTMLAAHDLDNRTDICSLKFQAFVNLGVPAYDDQIKQFLKARKDSKLNRVKDEVDMNQLLRYCGADSYLEWRLAQVQYRKVVQRPFPTIHVNQMDDDDA